MGVFIKEVKIYKINIPPYNGGYFIFGHSPTLYWLRTSALFIGLPAMQLLLATHKWVVTVISLVNFIV